jgi:precorrin-6A/cobalt-precorrin-6A reductase
MKLLLMAGASETGSIADALSMAGFHVIVSTVSDFPMKISLSERITRRVGALSADELSILCIDMDVAAIIDATHPYAVQAHANVRDSARRLAIPTFRYERPSAPSQAPGTHSARSHEQAARLAVSFKRPILLTSGTRNLEPYATLARSQGVELYVRALDCRESRDTIVNHGISLDHCEFGVGPFSVEDNMRLIERFDVGVLVTKDGGAAGGLPEKLEASRLMKCQVVLVSRPEANHDNVFNNISSLVEAVGSILQ